MDMPKTIRIGYRDFSVESWPSAIAMASDRLGECDKLNGILRVSDNLDGIKAANTLLHEVMHACWELAELDDKDEEEKTVGCLANQLTQVWRDNPKLVAFLNSQLGT